MQTENILHLLLVEDSSNDAEGVITVLRGAGYGVRPTRVTTQSNMETALNGEAWDIILCSAKLTDFSATDALTALKNSGKDIPFLLLSDSPRETGILEFLQAGARDVVYKDQPEHLQLVITREFGDLQNRRAFRHSERAFIESEKRCRSLMDNSRDAIAYVHDGMHIYANSVYLNKFGYQALDDIEGTPVMDLVVTKDHAQFKEFLRNYTSTEGSVQSLDVNGLRTDDGEFKLRMEFSPASIEGEACTQIIIRDISDNQEIQEQLQILSKQDLLTGLYNRQHFLDALDEAVRTTTDGSSTGALLYIELDNFRAIQDKVGIAAGDLVLGDIAKLLQTTVNDTGLLARFGDDVFTLLLNNKDSRRAQDMAETLRKAVEEGFYDAGGQSVTSTCHIGIGMITEQILKSHTLLSQVNKACSKSKVDGGNKVCLYAPDAEAQTDKTKLKEEVRQIQAALANNRFRLIYQPIVSMRGAPGEIYQVFLRLLDDQDNKVEAQHFMPIIERAGLTTAIDRWVIGRAAEVLIAQRQSHQRQAFFITLAGDTLSDTTMLPWISERLKTSKLKGDSLTFQITETAAFDHFKQTQEFIKKAKELHCHVALSHFGSNAKSLDHLKRLHAGVDYLRIDGSLLTNFVSNVENQNIVKAIHEMAQSLKIMTIADGIEDASTLALLWQYGINYVQGHYLQKPSETLNYNFSEAIG